MLLSRTVKQRARFVLEVFLTSRRSIEIVQVRVCANDQVSLTGAKRLAMRAASEASSTPSHEDQSCPYLPQIGSVNQLVSYRPPEYDNPSVLPTLSPLQAYSLYPFMSPHSLPWQINTSGTFRWRRVGDWLGIDQVENVKETGGLAGERGVLRDLQE